MRIILRNRNNIYGRWFGKSREFFFSEDGRFEMIRPDKNDEIKGYYKINDNKLIITLGSDGYDSFIWITNIISLNNSLLEIIDYQGDCSIEKFTRNKYIGTTKNNEENSNSSDGKMILKFSKNNTVTPFGCIGSILIGAFVVTVLVGAYEGVVKIFSELPTWLSTILNFAPLIGIIFYVNRNK